jgi:hypothetical protein
MSTLNPKKMEINTAINSLINRPRGKNYIRKSERLNIVNLLKNLNEINEKIIIKLKEKEEELLKYKNKN